jgi:hypothetical protein
MYVLFYSNKCELSRKLLYDIGKTHPKWKEQIIFLCVDRKIIDPITKQRMIILDNGQHIQLLECVKSTPSLLIKGSHYTYLEGDIVISFLKNEEKIWREKNDTYDTANLHSLHPVQERPNTNTIWDTMKEPSSYDEGYNSFTQSSHYTTYK